MPFNMRRTYQSKRATGSGFDHREVWQNLDEKSSLFDAFYINNIKQTKRELSCMGSSSKQHSVASNKVRKRKYVKRVVKEESPIREATSCSVYLTPDKSIRVNKAPDLFDQLLNSSPAWQRTPEDKQNNVFSVLAEPQEKRVHTRKKKTYVKKYNNYSSSDSTESEKENANNENTSINTTDIRAHELVIEKENKLRPKHFDESINKIVNNISILKNRMSRSPVFQTYKKGHRLTKTSPLVKNSPLSSTPFTEKYRSKSIFKFSPIAIKFDESLRDSPEDKNIKGNTDKHTVLEEEVQRLSLVSQSRDSLEDEKSHENIDKVTIPEIQVQRLSKVSQDVQSPILHLSCISNAKSRSNSKSLMSAIDEQSITENKIQAASYLFSDNKSSEKEALQITEDEFLGFTESVVAKAEDNIKIIEQISLDDTDVMQSTVAEGIHNKTGLGIDEQSTTENKGQVSSDLFSDDKSSEKETFQTTEDEFLGFAESVITKAENNVKIIEQISLDDTDVMQRTVAEGIYNETDIGTDDNSESNVDTDRSNIDKLSSHSEEADRESLYDTCNSDQSSLEDIDNLKKPVVVLEKMNNSSFMRYYCKLKVDSSLDEELDSTDDEETNSIDNEETCNSIDNEETYNSDNISCESSDSFVTNTSNISNKNIADDTVETISDDKKSTDEEEKCMSFVTTRRRMIVNDSIIYMLNNSFGSPSSSDCDKTVLSNKVNLVDNSDSKIRTSIESNKSHDLPQLNVESIKKDDDIADKKISFITTRRSSRTPQESGLSDLSMRSTLSEMKAPIILQPGKKWERSLSIYRRMTMMTDHFDRSVLEEELLENKGRKYRQSVISTMELQDTLGSLQNESINSRRSTFVSKPSRTTIKLVREPNSSRVSLCSTSIDDLQGFLSEDCDDTIVELSKLSIAESEHDITVLEKIHDLSSRVATARDYVLRRCNQTDTILFDECYPDSVLKNCRKIGEGVYGEVYLWRALDGRARVMKIVPIAGDVRVNGEHQKDFQEIVSEIVIAMELSALRAPIAEIEALFDEGKEAGQLDLHSVENATDIFNEVLAVRCVYGSYPSRLLDLWDLYDECKGSENDNPAILPIDQQYIVLELANAGQDLESFTFNSAEQAHALLLQVAFGLAVGEESFQFEHRDLHWGNVLIAPTDQKWATFVLRGRAVRLPRCGVAATIIDYSLSRISLPLRGEAAALYNDLATDEALFDAVGDYQFEVYRLMRDKLRNEWQNFEPYTNILWLHYTVDKMITALRYKRTNTKIHKHYIAKLKGIKNRILGYGSAVQFVLTDNEF